MRVVISSDMAPEHSKTQKNLLENTRHVCVVLPNDPVLGEEIGCGTILELTYSQPKCSSAAKLKNAPTQLQGNKVLTHSWNCWSGSKGGLQK